MALRFIGIDPDTGQQGSPTVWVDEEKAELVLQGLKPDEKLVPRQATFARKGAASGACSRRAGRKGSYWTYLAFRPVR